MRIRDIPADVRPRERLWRSGADALNDAELLALVIGGGHRGQSALDIAHGLLSEWGGLTGLVAAEPEELVRRTGVGPAKAGALVAALALSRRAARAPAARPLKSAADLADLVGPELRTARRERVLVVVLDAPHRVRRIARVTDGSADRALLPAREVLNLVLRNDGRAFAVAHNHPSGDPEPSTSDVESTRALAAAAAVVGLRFVDHVVMAESAWISLRERGLLR